MENLDEFDGIIVQVDRELNTIYSNKKFKTLKSSEREELLQTCAEVMKDNYPQRIQRDLGNQFFALMAAPMIGNDGQSRGVAITGYRISFKIFKDIVLDNMSDAVFFISLEEETFYFRGVNKMFLEIFNLKEEDVLDRDIFDVLPAIHRYDIDKTCREVLEKRQTLKRDVCANIANVTKYGDVVLTPVCNGGECRGLIGIVQDTTERKVAEIELAKNYSLLNELVETTSDVIMIKDLSGRFVLANSAAAKLANKSTFEFLGKNDLDIFDDVTASKFMTNDRLALDSAVMQYFEEEVTINNKHYFFHSAKGPYRDEKGKVAGTLGILRNITEMKLAERRLANSYSMLIATLNATADGILVLDMNKKITHYNERFLSFWKVSEELLIKNEYDQVLRKVLDQLQNPEECLERLNQLEKDPELESYDLLTFKDGRKLERYTIPQVLNGEVVGRVFSYREISRRDSK